MELKQKYKSIRDRIYEDYSLACKQLDEIICNPKEYITETYHNIKNSSQVKKDAVSTIAAATVFNPLNARIETTAGQLTNIQSITSRALSTIVVYGLVKFGMKGREKLQQKLGITKDSTRFRKVLFDMGYIAGVVFPIRIVTYKLAGVQEIDKILLNAGLMTGVGTLIGVPVLITIDAYKDLTGVDDTGTLPKIIKNRSKRFKKTLAIAYPVAGLAAMVTMYAISPNNKDQPKQLPKPDKEHQLILKKPKEKPELAGIEHVINQE